VLVLRVWEAERKSWTLRELLERAISNGHLKDINAEVTASEELDVLSRGSVRAKLGIALVETWSG
jgi:hypothetical protein